MPAKRQLASGLVRDEADDGIVAKRPTSVTPPHAFYSRSSASSSPSVHDTSYSSDPLSLSSHTSHWAQLPTVILHVIARSASFTTLLHVALVNRCLHRMVVQPGSQLVSHSSMWHHYPPVRFHAFEQSYESVVPLRGVRVGNDVISCTARSLLYESSLLSLYRHITELHLLLLQPRPDNQTVSHNVTFGLLTSLGHFTQLRSLHLLSKESVTEALLATALDALPSLVSLELFLSVVEGSEPLTASLHRLCGSQLDHLTLAWRQLHLLVGTSASSSYVSPSLTLCHSVSDD